MFRVRPPTGSGRRTGYFDGGFGALETSLVAFTVEDALLRLGDRQAMVLRRRHLAEEDWRTITQEMGFPNTYYAKQTYRQAAAKLADILRQEAPSAPSASAPTVST